MAIYLGSLPRRPRAHRRWASGAALITAAVLVVAGCGDDGGEDRANGATSSSTVLDQPTSNCFWSEPVNREHGNSQFPDTGATYWYASFEVPDGAVVRLRGEYPHGRYASFNVYGTDPVSGNSGTPFDGLADMDIAPDEGATNPFEVGADRTDGERSYQIELVGEYVPEDDGDRAPNTLYGVPAGEPTDGVRDQELIYRVYVPDEGRNVLGDAGLPDFQLELAGGTIETGEEACATLAADPVLPVDELPSLDEERYEELRALGSDPAHPAQAEPVFQRFFNAGHATFSTFYAGTNREGEIAAIDATPFGGYYSNLDNQYVLTVVDRALGPDPDGGNIVVLTGTAPSTPHTVEGQETMEAGDLRYWSLCQNESSVTTRVVDCLYDEQVPRDGDGRYTVVVSRPEDRPDNATIECGVGWLEWGPGDGIDRSEYGLLLLRHMLPSVDFEATIANVAEPGAEADVLGDLLPEVDYQTPAEFEETGCDG